MRTRTRPSSSVPGRPVSPSHINLKQHGIDPLVFTADKRVGDPWRQRWDSLRLFTPTFYDGLPGMPFPATDAEHLPTKDEVADYLESYAGRLGLQVRLGAEVHAVRRTDAGLLLETSRGPVTAQQVVVAAGAFRVPQLPPFAAELGRDIRQLHSSHYRNLDSLQPGDALVVGAGNSGTQIATDIHEADPTRRVWLAGRDTGRIPRRLLGRDIFRWLVPTVLRLPVDSGPGRLILARTAGRGDPVFADVHARMVAAGVERTGRMVGVRDGRPVVQGESGEVTPEVGNVVWCTGYRPDFSWIDGLPVDEHGRPRQQRGEVLAMPGLYVIGLHLLYRLSSSLIGGVGADAAYVAQRIQRRLERGTADAESSSAHARHAL